MGKGEGAQKLSIKRNGKEGSREYWDLFQQRGIAQRLQILQVAVRQLVHLNNHGVTAVLVAQLCCVFGRLSCPHAQQQRAWLRGDIQRVQKRRGWRMGGTCYRKDKVYQREWREREGDLLGGAWDPQSFRALYTQK